MIPRYIFLGVPLLFVAALLAGCGTRTVAPTVDQISVQPSTTLMPAETATLTINAEGTDLKFEWTVNRGSLSSSTQAAVIYTAPSSFGPDIAIVKISYSGGEIIRSITLDIISPPTPTLTASPIPADTPTAIPEPIACNSPAVTKNIFPQLADAE